METNVLEDELKYGNDGRNGEWKVSVTRGGV